TIRRLAEECPRIVGIKDSSGDVAQMMRMIEAVRPLRPDFSFLTGWDAVLMPMLLIGCDGGTNITSGIVPGWTRRLYELCLSRRLDEACQLQYRLRRLFDAVVYEADFPEACRVALEVVGFRTGPGRQPLSDEHQRKLAAAERTVRQLLAEEPPTGGADRDEAAATETSRIVEAVVAALRRHAPPA
ncbi:MAG TPA: dihydrodipicolinate synthase family protein, partial [Planctomycetaceae bacterium]|nr:dihydrodipicolinate synthase family protein [Planctomycetaceae bacterium]